MTTSLAGSSGKTRVRVFVDYWNFQLTLNEIEAAQKGLQDVRYSVDWVKLGRWLADKACQAAAIPANEMSFEGVGIYASYNPKTEEGQRFKKWFNTFLNRQAGIDAICLERKSKALPKCPVCHKVITHCPHAGCGKPMVLTVEKGVDTLIVTDMIRLAWEEAYDLAVLASLDADLIPAVEFLDAKGKKIVQAGFPPKGIDLQSACWASFDVFKDRKEIERKKAA